MGRVTIGQLVDGSKYRNLGLLVRRGYLEKIDEVESPAEAVEVPTEPLIAEVSEELVDELVVEAPVAQIETPAPMTPSTTKPKRVAKKR